MAQSQITQQQVLDQQQLRRQLDLQQESSPDMEDAISLLGNPQDYDLGNDQSIDVLQQHLQHQTIHDDNPLQQQQQQSQQQHPIHPQPPPQQQDQQHLHQQQQQPQQHQDQQQLQQQQPQQHQDQQQLHQQQQDQQRLQLQRTQDFSQQQQHQFRQLTPTTTASTSSTFSLPNPANAASYLPVIPTAYLSPSSPFSHSSPSYTSTPLLPSPPLPIPGVMVKIHLLTRDPANNIQSTPTSVKFCPSTLPNRHISNTFYDFIKNTYMMDLKNTVPYKQMNQIGVRYELLDMTAGYTDHMKRRDHLLNLSSPLTSEAKATAPPPLIQTHPDYGIFMEINIHFLLKLHRPAPESYTLSLADRNLMKNYIEQTHRTRPKRLTTPPIHSRVGYQTAQFQNRILHQLQQPPPTFPLRHDPFPQPFPTPTYPISPETPWNRGFRIPRRPSGLSPFHRSNTDSAMSQE